MLNLIPHHLTLCLLIISLILGSCRSNEVVDLIIIGKMIYAPASTKSNAIVIKEDSIVEIGIYEEIKENYAPKRIIDRAEYFIYPGFIDAHCHFLGYGQTRFNLDLKGTSSFEEVINTLLDYDSLHSPEFFYGRGWDQNDWEDKSYPDRHILDSLFPNRPVLIRRVDGHAALANLKALELAEIDTGSSIEGGFIEVISGRLTGILVDNAVDIVKDKLPAPDINDKRKFLLRAQDDCLQVGLTTVDDAGMKRSEVELIESMHKEGSLKMRVYAMLDPNEENFNWMKERGPFDNGRLNVNSFKVYADGALGSRGAKLKEDYADKPNHKGIWVNDSAYFDSIAREVRALNMQMNTHCIGDEANKMLLNTYARVLFGPEHMAKVLRSENPEELLNKQRNHRWRIEHAQVVSIEDIPLFGKYGVIPSVQPTHATSDMYWAEERLGPMRMAGAYAYKSLMHSYGMIAAGSDFPVEHINPLFGFYAAVSRRDHKGIPKEGFIASEALSREEALMAMTIWAAHSNFEEEYKGSLEKGKLADIVILDQDIMTINIEQILNVEVIETIIGGEVVYSNNEN